ncbi:MAG: hypothetical protein IJ193_07690 [Bacilli bacterium]|nr:hypothetical protein [Bacilli bacterium]
MRKEDIIILENYLEEANDSLVATKKELKETIKEKRKIRNTEVATGAVLVGALSLGAYLSSIDKMGLGLVLQGGSIAFAAGFIGSMSSNKPKKKYIKATKEKVKNLTILQSALRDELELQKEKSNEIVKTNNSAEKTLTAEDLVYEYDFSKTEMQQDYLYHDRVDQKEYGDLENRIFTRMIEKEFYAKQKSLTK